ncbi:MAG: DUF2670 domain-containing protein [Pseudomonadota bacterium]
MLRKIIRGSNPIGMFIYAILSKWYFIIALPAVMVAYWGLKGLEEAGVLKAAETVISKGLLDVKAVAQHCTPKIANLQKFWECLENTDKYIEHENEGQLKKTINAAKVPDLQISPYEAHPQHPYRVK